MNLNSTQGHIHMQLSFSMVGLSVEIVGRLPHAFYVLTNNHEFAWSREEWFSWPSGKWRHWVIVKKEAPEGLGLNADDVTAA